VESIKIKLKAKELGFSACGIARAHSLQVQRPALEKWLSEGMNGSMDYMSRNFEMRLDPAKIVEEAKSVISVIINYFPSQEQSDPEAPVISKYAYGKDYHFILKDKLNQLLQFIQSEISPCNGRAFVDSAPVMERAWARESGLGWIGKHSLLINKIHGSFVFIGELIIDLELDYSGEIVSDHCGSCTRCIDACPTKAIVSPHVVDARKCISYLTIESKEEIPSEFHDQLNNRVFGCDICQDVCPWNKKIIPTLAEEFKPTEGLLEMTQSDWQNLDQPNYRKRFRSTPFERAGYKKIVNTINYMDQK
jgi:epoxyqueuosine reductase